MGGRLWRIGATCAALWLLGARLAAAGITVEARFVGASAEEVVAWAARATGRDGFVIEGTVREVDVSTGPVSAHAALNAVVDGLEGAGLRVEVSQTALTVGDPALPADAAHVQVAWAASADAPRGACPGSTARAALGPVDASLRVFGTPVRPEPPLGAGLRLSGIPRGGPVAALGLRSGDVLEALDGPVRWRPADGLPALKANLAAAVEINVPVTFRVRRRGVSRTWTCHVVQPGPQTL